MRTMPRKEEENKRSAVNSMRRNVERMYNLPPGEREIAEAFFARADAKNAAGELKQETLDLFFFDMLIRHRFAHYARCETDPDYILFNS